MRRVLFVGTVVSLILVKAPMASGGGGGAHVVNVGTKNAPGVSSRAFQFSSSVSSAASADFSSAATEAREYSNVPVLVVEATNRCTATNVGGEFNYSFANGVECASFAAPSPDPKRRGKAKAPRPPSPEQIAAALFDRAVSLAPDPRLQVSPSRIGLTGLRSYFWLADSPRPVVARASAGPTTVTAIAVPSEFVWDFGEGTQLRTQDAGRAWRPRRTGSIGHLYQTAGRHDLSVEIVWRASWRIGRGAWRPLGVFTTSDSRTYPVRELIAWLVRRP